MRWKRGHRSADVVDRRGSSGGRRIGRRGGLGLGGLALLFLFSLIFKQDFFTLLDQAGGAGAITGSSASLPAQPPAATSAVEQERFDFVNFVVDDVQDVWAEVLPRIGQSYPRAKTVIFRDAVRTACGVGRAASGPFYCPGDQQVYLDLSFFDELHGRFGAPGDFAQAYVIAHEVGHHVQQVLGIERQVRQLQGQRRDMANELSVRMELQADCLAGVWANSTAERQLLERGDVEEGLGAAAAVGDDRIQQKTAGYVNPDAFTHGTSAQRVDWFRRGFKTGDPDVCDTFSADRI